MCKGCFRLHFALLVGYPLCLENLFRTRDDEGALLVVGHARVDRVHFVVRLRERLAVLGVHAEPARHFVRVCLCPGGLLDPCRLNLNLVLPLTLRADRCRRLLVRGWLGHGGLVGIRVCSRFVR